MNAPRHVQEFQKLDLCEDAAVHELATEQLQIFWVLRAAGSLPGRGYLTPAEISDILADCCAVSIPRQRVSAILEGAGNAVGRRRLNKRNCYKIMRPGLDALGGQGHGPILIDPATALTQIRRIESIFGKLTGLVRICDPYLDNKTLDLLSLCAGASEIHFLTVTVHKESTFRRDLAAFRREHRIPIEVRLAAPGKHHDRYVISDDDILQFGASLNGIAKKQSFIIPLPRSMRALLEKAFKTDWDSSNPFQ